MEQDDLSACNETLGEQRCGDLLDSSSIEPVGKSFPMRPPTQIRAVPRTYYT
jgi:hypothetical protein